MNVALIYMPFGPVNLPGFGMEVLAETVRRGGHSCMVKYFNLGFVDFVPGDSFIARARKLYYLCGRHSFPFNEHLFARELYSDACLADLGIAANGFRLRRDNLVPHIRNDSFDRSFQLEPVEFHRLRDAVPEFLDSCLDQLDGFDLLGFSSSFHQNLASLALARRVKMRWPAVRVALGGANCDSEMGPALHETHPWVDFVFSGEADFGFPELLERLAAGNGVDDVRGVAYCADGVPRSNGPALPVKDLENVATPDYRQFIDQVERSSFRDIQPLTLVLESSRGCWWGAKHHCTFCGLNAGGMAFRQKSVDRMLDEFAQVAPHEPDLVAMGDNIMPVAYFGDFLDRLAKQERPLKLFYETKANLKRSVLTRMKRAGINLLQPGIESFDSGVLQLMKKGVRAIQNVRLLRDAREVGIQLTYSILYGFPGEDPLAYRRMARQLADLEHLQPPGAVVRVEYHRFSPYQMNPASLGLTGLRPLTDYRFVYPWSDAVLRRIAYFFDADYPYPEDPEEYILPISRVVAAWKSRFNAHDCLLVHVPGEAHIDIVDRRRSPGVRYVMAGFASAVYGRLREEAGLTTLCHAPTEEPAGQAAAWFDSLFGDTAARDAERARYQDLPSRVYDFDQQAFQSCGGDILEEWLGEGLVFRDEDTYLALSVPYDWRRSGGVPLVGQPQ